VRDARGSPPSTTDGRVDRELKVEQAPATRPRAIRAATLANLDLERTPTPTPRQRSLRSRPNGPPAG